MRSRGRIATGDILDEVDTVPYMAGITAYVYWKLNACFTDVKPEYKAVSKVIFSTQLSLMPVAKDMNDRTSALGML